MSIISFDINVTHTPVSSSVFHHHHHQSHQSDADGGGGGMNNLSSLFLKLPSMT